MSIEDGIFSEQSLPLVWAFGSLNKLHASWNAFVAAEPFETFEEPFEEKSYYIKARLRNGIPPDFREHVHTIMNGFRHSLDQVTNQFSQLIDPELKKELHFPWATSVNDLRSQLKRKHPKSDETSQMYESFGCFWAETGGDENFRNLAKAVNRGKHQLSLVVKPVPAWTEVRGEFKKGVPADGTIAFADVHYAENVGDETKLAVVRDTPAKLEFTINPAFVFGREDGIEGLPVIGLLGYALDRTRGIIEDMEGWIERNGYVAS